MKKSKNQVNEWCAALEFAQESNGKKKKKKRKLCLKFSLVRIPNSNGYWEHLSLDPWASDHSRDFVLEIKR